VQIAGICVISNDLQIENGIIKLPSNIWLTAQETTCASAQSAPSLKKTEQYFFGRSWGVAQTSSRMKIANAKI
jgi:hypothetical protein